MSTSGNSRQYGPMMNQYFVNNEIVGLEKGEGNSRGEE